jgi:hypothetical protein
MRRQPTAFLLAAALTSAVAALAGCRAGGLFPPPGPLNQQQANAIVHDPYPQNDIAPYEAASRPPSYQEPLPEPVRNRLVPDAMPWLGR